MSSSHSALSSFALSTTITNNSSTSYSSSSKNSPTPHGKHTSPNHHSNPNHLKNSTNPQPSFELRLVLCFPELPVPSPTLSSSKIHSNHLDHPQDPHIYTNLNKTTSLKNPLQTNLNPSHPKQTHNAQLPQTTHTLQSPHLPNPYLKPRTQHTQKTERDLPPTTYLNPLLTPYTQPSTHRTTQANIV